MATQVLPQVFTVEDAADYFRVSRDAVLTELEQGRLHGFKIGNEWRLTESDIADFLTRTHNGAPLEQVARLTPEYGATGFIEIGPFEYKWPANKEWFEGGFETTKNMNGRLHAFRVGFTDRQAAGLIRRRVVVWIDSRPIVEFAGGNNYASDGLLAGIIKTRDGRQLRPSAKIPEEYRGLHVARYDSIVQGAYASKNMALIVHKHDLESIIRHAVIRGTWKQLI